MQKNPDLLDWFELLNSAKSTKIVPEIDEAEVKEAAIKQAQLEEEEKNKDIVKIDHSKIEKIVRLKNAHEKKGTKVRKLEKKVDDMHGQTEEQLHAIIKQIQMLSGQVKEQL